MRFKDLDLNLLVAFDALTETRSVTQAAKRLSLSQPAISAALDRLRRFFGDQLLVPNGKQMMPTAAALSMRPIVKAILGDVDTLIAASQGFDPATSQRVFRIVASDYIGAVIVTPLCAVLQKLAPQVRLDVRLPSEVARQVFLRGEIDLFLAPEEFCAPGHPTELLLEERHVVVGWSGNPAMSGPVSERDFLRLGHVGVTVGNVGERPFAEMQLEKLSRTCRYEIMVPAFSLVPGALTGTSRLAVMHERLARALASKYSLVMGPMPFPIPLMREMLQHHTARDGDVGLSWLRSMLLQAASNNDIASFGPGGAGQGGAGRRAQGVALISPI